jgi:hypothetical protein
MSETEMKFTPGPWEIKARLNISDSDRTVIEETLYEIVAGERKGPFENKGHFHPSQAVWYTHEIDVVAVETDMDYGYHMGGIKNKADAHLIAAAPDLYEALTKLLAIYCSVLNEAECSPEMDSDIKEFRAVLAKARGEAMRSSVGSREYKDAQQAENHRLSNILHKLNSPDQS